MKQKQISLPTLPKLSEYQEPLYIQWIKVTQWLRRTPKTHPEYKTALRYEKQLRKELESLGLQMF